MTHGKREEFLALDFIKEMETLIAKFSLERFSILAEFLNIFFFTDKHEVMSYACVVPWDRHGFFTDLREQTNDQEKSLADL